MNFKKKGWFKKYLKFREENPFDLNFPTQNLRIRESAPDQKHDEAIYAFLQPTGILYGFPLSLPFQDLEFPNQKYFDEEDIGLLVFLESLYACLLFEKQEIESQRAEEVSFKGLVQPTMEFFLRTHDNLYVQRKKIKSIFQKGTKDDLYHRFEMVLKKRIHLGAKGSEMAHYFSNSLLLIDLYFALIWQREKREETGKKPEQEQIASRIVNLHEGLLDIVIAATHANKTIEKEEKKIFEQVLDSSDLNRSLRKKYREKFQNGIGVKDILVEDLPWLIKRFYLEMGLMTVLSDEVLEDSESEFIEALAQKLGFDKDDLDQSKLAVETFLLSHQKYLSLSRRKYVVDKISSRWRIRVRNILMKNKDRLAKEFDESQELYQLLLKSRTSELNQDEKEKVRVQLMDILKTIPPIVIIALPGTFITLPIMLSVMPKSMLPSSFQDD